MKKMVNMVNLLILVCGVLMMKMAMQTSARLTEKTTAYAPAPYAPAAAKEYIVFTDVPKGHPRSHYLDILSNVLGSKKEAKNALIYTYTTAFTGFSAMLTPQQAEDILRQPKVLEVIHSEKIKLYPGN